LSRNYRVGYRLAQGESLEKILTELASTAEGVPHHQKTVWEYAAQYQISMPITEGVYRTLDRKSFDV
jgi:glycerol-3-phosphate dehydrogenase